MTRSIFDPDGRETERSGSTFTSAHAADRSKLPPDVTDGEVSPEEATDAESIVDADAKKLSPEERIDEIRGHEQVPEDVLDPDAPGNGP